ncbi:MAG: hypothetical protein IJ742_00180, partial [Prevotella sp.]|nr:hypothetical protein [Prevotella sp.]
ATTHDVKLQQLVPDSVQLFLLLFVRLPEGDIEAATHIGHFCCDLVPLKVHVAHLWRIGRMRRSLYVTITVHSKVENALFAMVVKTVNVDKLAIMHIEVALSIR